MIKEITSRNNSLIVDLIKLKQKKYRKERGLVLIEGERFVAEMAQRGVEFEYLLFKENPNINVDCTLIKCNDEVLSALAQTVTPSNVVGVVKVKKYPFIPPSTNFLILDHIQDPGNLGTIIRTALAFDFRYIYLYNCVDYTNDKVLRATMGTIADIVPIECGFAELSELTKFPIYSADLKGENFHNIQAKNICGLILGNEANGISTEIANLSSHSISIPMQNNVESLNVAVAGGILMSKFSK